jgi:hypothetical protein
MKDYLVIMSDLLFRTVLSIINLVANPYVVIDSVHLMNLLESKALEEVTVSMIPIKLVAPFAEIVLAVSAVIEDISWIASFKSFLLAPGAAAIKL